MSVHQVSLRKLFPAMLAAVALAAVSLSLGVRAEGETYRILYTFKGGTDGVSPYGNLLPDGAGGFYGTTHSGGSTTACFGYGCGTVYHLTPPSTQGAAWTETILHSFIGSTTDGEGPTGNIVKDAAGNLYGTTVQGGPANTGTVYELSPPAQAGGAWTETIVHTFTYGTPDGDAPTGGLILGPGGVLYGETYFGGWYDNQYCEGNGCGTIFQLTPPAQPGGAWSESVIYEFQETGCCGSYSALVLKGGNLYGAAAEIGLYYQGGVFELSPPFEQGGPWDYVYSLPNGGSGGYNLFGGVVIDSAGNIYGATNNGGEVGGGTVFELTHPSWTFDVIHNFSGSPDGTNTQAPLTVDSEGNVYGGTEAGGYTGDKACEGIGCGIIFKLSNSGGSWTETILHSFVGGHDGSTPIAPVTVRNGIVYGTTDRGGAEDYGIIFAITP